MRINLATPFRGRRMAGTAQPTRGEEIVRRFVGGFVLGAVLVAAVALVALALSGLAAHRHEGPGWTYLLDQELARVDGELRPALDTTARLGAALRAAEELAAADGIFSRLGIERLTPAEERGAHLVALDTRGRLGAALDGWDERLAEIAAAPEPSRQAATRVLALLRWQVEGGELAPSLEYYETRIAAAVAALTPPPAPTETPTATKRR